MPKEILEEKIAKFATWFIGGSLIFAVAGLFIVFGFAQVAAGNTALLVEPLVLLTFLFALLYAISIYLLATLAGKSVKRRLISWLYSMIFHAALLLYLAIYTGLGDAVFIVCMAESAILLLCVLGLSAFIFNYRKCAKA